MSDESSEHDTAGVSDLEASIGGGPWGPWYEVAQVGAALHYSARSDSAIGVTPVVTPSPEQWAAFRGVLDAIDVSTWRAEYVEPHVMDGTCWSVRLVIDGRTVASEGSNKYPRGFKRFCAALEALLGGQEFR